MLDRLARINIYSINSSIAAVIGCALFTAVVLTDYITSYELSLTPFYLFVVLLVTWNCGWKLGLVFAALSFAAPLVIGEIDGTPYSEPIYFYIDNANRLISYLVAMALTAQLKRQHEREKNSARLDYLTGVANLKGFYEELGIELARHRREKAPMSVAYFDCDNFKEVNDRFGHNNGDELLKDVGRILKSNVRKIDVVGRLGGDEFGVILSKTDELHALEIVSKLRSELDDRMKVQGWPVTFSIGVGAFVEFPDTEDKIMSFADKLMYRVKRSGKNQVCSQVYSSSSEVIMQE